MGKANLFIAVSKVTVTDHEGNPRLSGPFLNVHRDKIEVIMPICEEDGLCAAE
jgi:hypothetical protein